MAFYGLVTHFMVFYFRTSSFLAVIDPNSFGLVPKKFTFYKDQLHDNLLEYAILFDGIKLLFT